MIIVDSCSYRDSKSSSFSVNGLTFGASIEARSVCCHPLNHYLFNDSNSSFVSMKECKIIISTSVRISQQGVIIS